MTKAKFKELVLRVWLAEHIELVKSDEIYRKEHFKSNLIAAVKLLLVAALFVLLFLCGVLLLPNVENGFDKFISVVLRFFSVWGATFFLMQSFRPFSFAIGDTFTPYSSKRFALHIIEQLFDKYATEDDMDKMMNELKEKQQERDE